MKHYAHWKEQWLKPQDIDIFSYIGMEGDPEKALAFCAVLFPSFIVRDNAVFLDFNYSDAGYEEWYRPFQGDISLLESVINHVHLFDVFSHSSGIEEVVFVQLANVIALSWNMLLRDKFPDRNFCVEMSNIEQDYGPIITFFQVSANR